MGDVGIGNGGVSCVLGQHSASQGHCGDDGGFRQGCHGGRDGECIWAQCPQLRDGEPMESGRDCPLWSHDDEY